LGEFDGDPFKEIVVGGSDGRMHVLNHDGSEVTGWPQTTRPALLHSPAIADLDGDGWDEIIAGQAPIEENGVSLEYLYAWHRDGTPVAGWPIREIDPEPYFGFSPVAVADLDGDGRLDVATSTDGFRSYSPKAYDRNGHALAGFPKPTFFDTAWESNAPAVGDVDGDGLLEMVWVDYYSNLYVWDLPGPSSGPQPWPMYNHDAQHTGSTSAPSGRVPDGGSSAGTPLMVSRDAGGQISVTWDASCTSTDNDYEVYEGVLGQFASHTPRVCSTNGATTTTFSPSAGSSYYLVVPRNPSKEGSYGDGSGGMERPQGLGACLPQELATICQ
jgi:hypothetical protein